MGDDPRVLAQGCEAMNSLTYLAYIVFWESLTLGGCAYCVFWKEASPWWFLLAVFMSSHAYSPEKWAALVAP